MTEHTDSAKDQEIARLHELLRQQELSAMMLVRRDRELQQAHERLRELDRMKSEFVSVAAHQLRTPLSAVKWSMKLLLDGDLGALTDQQKSVLMKGYESTERIINQVNNLLASERINSGKVSFSPVCLTDLIENLVMEVQKSSSQRGIDVRFHRPEGDFPYVTGDPEKIRALMQNLVENAVKYSPEGGAIDISAAIAGTDVEVSIQDQGIGIPEAEQDEIFSRFYRGKNAVRVQTDGSGLGLYIARQVVNLHGGEIWFKSAENEGTTFFFTLPQTQDTPAQVAAAQVAEDSV